MHAKLEGKYAAKDTGILPSAAVSSTASATIHSYPTKFFCAFGLSPSRSRKRKRKEMRQKELDTDGADAEGYEIRNPSNPSSVNALIGCEILGMTGTVAWSSLNLIDAKIEADNNIAKGLKVEALAAFKPDSQDLGVKSNLYFKHGNANLRLMADLIKQSTNVDLVFGQEGFLVGGEAGYDVQKAALTRYSATVAYQQAAHTAAITATNNFSIFAASLYNKVNAETEIGIKAAWDSKSSSTVGMEFAAKYKVDPLSFVKVSVPLSSLWISSDANLGLIPGQDR